MHLKISHTTEYHYDEPVQYALQRLRLTPLTQPGQTVLGWQTLVDGAAIEVSYDDHFGNRVHLVSVDGDRDTPAVMKQFLARYPEELIGLTAPPNRVMPVAEQFSAAFFKGAHDAHGAYAVAHSPQIFVLDAAGNLRAELFGASIESMTAVALALLAER